MANTTLSWQQLFAKLRLIIGGGPQQTLTVNKQAIISLLARYKSHEDDFKPYLFFDESGYTKNLVEQFEDNKCNVIVMCWSPKQSSAFHGHEGSKCFVKVLSGELLEQQVPYPKVGQQQGSVEEKILVRNDVSYIDDDSIGLHKVTNVSANKPAITLHIYMPAYNKCRIFDNKTGDNKSSSSNNINKSSDFFDLNRSKTIDVTYYSKSGKKVDKQD